MTNAEKRLWVAVFAQNYVKCIDNYPGRQAFDRALYAAYDAVKNMRNRVNSKHQHMPEEAEQMMLAVMEGDE